jgi:hypothetical protein
MGKLLFALLCSIVIGCSGSSSNGSVLMDKDIALMIDAVGRMYNSDKSGARPIDDILIINSTNYYTVSHGVVMDASKAGFSCNRNNAVLAVQFEQSGTSEILSRVGDYLDQTEVSQSGYLFEIKQKKTYVGQKPKFGIHYGLFEDVSARIICYRDLIEEMDIVVSKESDDMVVLHSNIPRVQSRLDKWFEQASISNQQKGS